MSKSGKLDKEYSLDLDDQDIYDAMKAMPGYLDITPGDFKDLYTLAYQQAMKRIAGAVTARDVMTTPVVTVVPDMSLKEAANIMAARKVSGVPVIETSGQVAGMLSERDFLAHMGKDENKTFMDVIAGCLDVKGCAAIGIREKKVQDIMSSPAIVVGMTMELPAVSALLKKEQINRLPVVDKEQKLAGIISREDIVHTPLLPVIS